MRTFRSAIWFATANWQRAFMMQAGGYSCSGLPDTRSCIPSPLLQCHPTIPVRNAPPVAPSLRSRLVSVHTSVMAVVWFWTAIITLLSTFCKRLFLLIKTVPRGTREPTSWSRKTLLDTEPLLLYQQWTVASSMGEGRTPALLRRGVSDLL